MKGWLHHIDITVASLERSTEYYDHVLPLMGFRRSANVLEGPIWAGKHVEVGLVEAKRGQNRLHDRFTPGLHHLAFGADDRAAVDSLHCEPVALGVTVLDAPAEYPQYAAGYYAVFFADPDGIKLEYVYTPKWPTG